MRFTIKCRSGRARRATLVTRRGKVNTPVFMPVGTLGTVKAMSPDELRQMGAEIILANTYHLYLRPGHEIIERLGGIHGFMNWQGPLLTDSGGFQVFSLANLRKVMPEGVSFRSHIDGSEHFFDPERAMRIQRSLGAEIVMCLDECTPHPATFEYALKSQELTSEWARRCSEIQTSWQDQGVSLFGIIQGSTYPDLRAECADRMAALEFPGYAMGGLSVGEGPQLMAEMVSCTLPRLPREKPRYLMGVGRPEELLTAIALGVDMFDCVIPTRCGRNGLAFTSLGRVKMRNLTHQNDERPLDPACDCLACTRFSRAYLRHLLVAGEVLGLTLMSLHNICYYVRLMKRMRQAIIEKRFPEFRDRIAKEFSLE